MTGLLALPDPTGAAFDPDAGNGDDKEFAMERIVAMIQAVKADGNVEGDDKQQSLKCWTNLARVLKKSVRTG